MALNRFRPTDNVLLFTLLILLAGSQAYHLKRNFQSVRQEEFDTYGSLDCMTPNNGPGRCVTLTDCPTLTQLLEKPNRQIVDYIRNSSCGLIGSEKSASGFLLDLPIAWFSWVCCPTDKPVMKPPTKPSTGADKRPLSHLLPKDCGISNVGRNRVVGGHEAPIGAWPWMAMLLYQFNRTGQLFFQCAGVLITNQHVITASHCVQTGADLVAVRLGEHNIVSLEDDAFLQDVAIRRIIPHEKFSLNPLANDVAVLKLEHKVTFNDRVRPACLPLDDSLDPESLEGEKVYVAGWGLTQEGGNLSSVLKEAEVPIVSLSDCIEAHKDISNANVDDTVTCTGYPEGGVGTCQGDSGGPLMWPVGDQDRFHVLGLVRSAVGCARPGFPAMFTRVDRYIDWILSKLQ